MKLRLSVAGIGFLLLHASSVNAEIIDRLSAAVNDQAILDSDVKGVAKNWSLRKELDPTVSLLQGFNLNSRKDKIALLIDDALILQAFNVSNAEVEQEISNIIRNNNLTHEQLETFLGNKGFKFNEYFEMMRIGLSKRALLDREIRTRVNISDEDIKNYFFNTESLRAKTIVEYDFQIIAIEYSLGEKKQKQELAQNIYAQLTNKEKNFDQMPGYQGSLGFLKLNQLHETLQPEAKKLKVGNLSSVIHANNQFIILKLNDVRLLESNEYLEKKEMIRELLAKNEYRKQLELWRSRQQAYIHVHPEKS